MTFLAPAFWPVSNILSTLIASPDEKFVQPKATAYLDALGVVFSVVAAMRHWGLALCIMYYQYGDGQYPAYGVAATLDSSWMLPMLVRNLIGTWVICLLWDGFLYFSPFSAKLRKYKIVQSYPPMKQYFHDFFWTNVGTAIATGIEIAICHWYATGRLGAVPTLSETMVPTIIWAATTTFWRIPHFWAIHRAMHNWRPPFAWIPDIGKLLYKHVHSLHHRSPNPSAVSGTSMHPVEATAYYSAALIPLVLAFYGVVPIHPSIPLTCLLDCAIGAWLGHDGFQYPGSGDHFHILHHQHTDCNFGAQHVPLDWLFGTFAGDKDDLRRIWMSRQSAATLPKKNAKTPTRG